MNDELDAALEELEAGAEAPLYLLHGEEFLVRKGAQALLKKLLPAGDADLNLVTLDTASPREVVAELDTLPMFGGRKVVLLRDPEFLAPKKGRVDALGRAREAWKAGRRKEAARRVLALAARAGWGLGDLDPSKEGAPTAEEWERELGVSLAEVDLAFLKEVAAFARAEGISAPSSDDSALTDWLASGRSRGQVLVVVTTAIEAKNTFVKAAKSRGRVLELKVAAKLKDLDLTEFVREALAPHHKKLGPGTLEKLKDRVGANLRLLHSELDKLALHTEDSVITAKDVDLLVGHAREDEWLELSDALQKRDVAATLKYVEDCLSQGSAPLAILGAITNIIRTLLTSSERMQQLSGGKPPRGYGDFQARIWPQIEAEVKATKGRLPHPYAVFMGMQAAGAFRRQELIRSLVACAETDLALKLGGGALALERLVWTVAGKQPAWESGMHVIRREQER